MKTLRPLLQFEAGRQSQSRLANWLRVGFVAMLVLSSLFFYGQHLHFTGNVVGAGWAMLEGQIALNYLLLVVAGSALFATPVTEEREGGTLPLLVTAGVPLRAIVASKGLSRLLPVLVLLAVQLPILVGAAGFGGFSLLDQLVPALALLCGLAVSLFGCGLLLSTLCLRGSSAQGFLLLTILVVDWGGTVADSLVVGRGGLPGWAGRVVEAMLTMNDWSVAFQLGQTSLGFSPGGQATTLAGWHLTIGLVAAALAVAVSEPWLQRTFRIPPKVDRPFSVRRTRPLRGDAVFAQAFRFGIGGVPALAIRVALYAAAAIGVLALVRSQYRLSPTDQTTLLYALAAGLVVVDVWLHSSRLLARDITDRTLPSIVLAGVPVTSLLVRKLLAVSLLVIPGLVLAAGIAALAPEGAVGWRRFVGLLLGESSRWILLAVLLQAAAFAHLTILCSIEWPSLSLAFGPALGLIAGAAVLIIAAVVAWTLPPSETVEIDYTMVVTYLSLLELIGIHLLTIQFAKVAAAR